MVGFINIAFVVLKLKIFNVFLTNYAPMKWPFLGGFWALTSPNMVQFY